MRIDYFSQIPPPFKPQVSSDTDVRYFDIEFTDESVELTPPDEADVPSEFSPISELDDDGTFEQFSYQDPNSILSPSSIHSRTSLPIHTE